MKKSMNTLKADISFFEEAKPIGWFISQIAGKYEKEFLRKLTSEKQFSSITASDHRVLKYLASESSNSMAVSRKIGVSKQAISKSISSLESRGFIVRQESEQDRRAQLLMITEKGRKLVSSAIRASLELEQLTEKILGKKDLDSLKKMLNKISQSID